MNSIGSIDEITLDIKAVVERTGLDLEDYLEIYELFQDNYNELMTELKNALEQKDTDSLMRTAHTIKGSTSNIGFSQLSDIAREIQDNPGDFEMITEAIPQMEAIYKKLDSLVQSETADMQ